MSGQLLAHAHVSDKDIGAYKHATKKVRQKNRELQSLRCDFVYKMQVAIDLRGAEALYYPHNLDFRGRAYTMHPHLNHLGADNCRGLLLFADAKPLGKEGLRWLMIQAANSFATGGVDKYTLQKREEWAYAKVDLIRDSADNPLEGERFWLKAEDPWQFLAACFEIRDAFASGDPESFRSRLPCHQDGSCNGLQHYAALGRDELGGRSVNLVPGEKPGDVYSCAEAAAFCSFFALLLCRPASQSAGALQPNLSCCALTCIAFTLRSGIAALLKQRVKDDLNSGEEEARAQLARISLHPPAAAAA